jgi:hypothetical protein
LIVAGLLHVSVVLQQQQQQQQQQQDPSGHLSALAYSLAEGTLFASYTPTSSLAAAATNGTQHYGDPDSRLELIQFMQVKGPHLLVWSDIHLLLVTYANILQQHSQLPATAAQQQAAAAEHPSVPVTVSAVTAHQQEGVFQALTAWQKIQGQWERSIPASHKQLLELLKVSPQTAVWLAARMPKTKAAQWLAEALPKHAATHRGEQTTAMPRSSDCWMWNPHNAGTCDTMSDADVPGHWQEAQGVREQLLQWVNTPLPELVHVVLVYGLVHSDDANGMNVLLDLSARCSRWLHQGSQLMQPYMYSSRAGQ